MNGNEYDFWQIIVSNVRFFRIQEAVPIEIQTFEGTGVPNGRLGRNMVEKQI